MHAFRVASEVTLVDTSAISGSDIVFTLSEDDPENTVLYLSGDPSAKPAYTVVTGWNGRFNVTRALNSSGEEIASSEWHDSSGDEVTLPASLENGEKKRRMKLSNWMPGGLFQSTTRCFQDRNNRKYQWERYAAYCNIILRAKDHPGAPIARFQKSHRASASSDGTEIVPATLTLTPRAQEIQDTVVISCLFLERNRRVNVEKTYTARRHGHALCGDGAAGMVTTGVSIGSWS